MRDLISSWVMRCVEARVPGFTTRFSVRREWVVPILFRLGGSRDEANKRPFGRGVVVSCGLSVVSWLPSKGRLSGGTLICGVEYVGRQKIPLGVSNVFATLWSVYGPVVACGGGMMSSVRQPVSHSAGGVPVMSHLRRALCNKSMRSRER